MSWKKYFSPVPTGNNPSGSYSPLGGAGGTTMPGPAARNYNSHLPDVYVGSPNRIERYRQYNTMDADSEVNAALDILAEFCTQVNQQNNTSFKLDFNKKATNSETTILQQYLQQWYKLNKLETRMFRLIRNAFKYGDQIFVRDPETKKLFHVDPANLTKVIVNESEGKTPEQYIIRDFNINFKDMVATTPHQTQGQIDNGRGTQYQNSGSNQGYLGGSVPSAAGTRFSREENEIAVSAEHVLHLSMSEGLDNNYPFGNSLLETIFKVYKQKELLEDAIIIYRVQRAPERRVFYVDVGNMPSHLAMQFVERVKTEIHQRRIPSQTGGGQSVIDSSYNPLSINEDFFFPQTCLGLDTEIKLLDDRSLTLAEIISEYNEGKTNYAYTVNQKTHELEPGKIAWAGVTRKNAQVVKVTLDNSESVTCTPDHRFIMRDGSEVEAQHLVAGNSIMPLYLHDAKTSKHQGANKYLKYTCPSDGKKKWVHTMVCPKANSGKDTEIHHIDCNSRNNNPHNLIEMDTAEHRQLHKKLGSYHLINAWKDKEKRQNLLNGIRRYHKYATDDDRKMFAKRGKINGAKTWKNAESSNKVLKALENTRKRVNKEKTITISDGMCSRLVDLYNNGYDSISKLVKKLREDETFQQEFKIANHDLLRDKNRPEIMLPTDRSLRKMAVHMGYDDWQDFKENYAPNHSVISVEWLEDTIDTGDITVESASNSHNFALTIGIFVHNSEGRGSKVETLPGGSNLGEIDDLRYFTNKLVRGLRIPSSYLPTGAEDASSQYNDGRVGTAYIQELRFNTYCERLQGLLVEEFDKEFKRYLLEKGVNIDTTMFDLKFQPPQNFAAYRQSEIDNARIPTFTQMSAIPYISNRFAMKRFLGLTEEEIAENERLWRDENDENLEPAPSDAAGEMRGAGISGAGIEGDLGNMEDIAADTPIEDGGEGTAPETQTDQQLGGAPQDPRSDQTI
jgi:hypothetical protein